MTISGCSCRGGAVGVVGTDSDDQDASTSIGTPANRRYHRQPMLAAGNRAERGSWQTPHPAYRFYM
jgi:hypothetical protein